MKTLAQRMAPRRQGVSSSLEFVTGPVTRGNVSERSRYSPPNAPRKKIPSIYVSRRIASQAPQSVGIFPAIFAAVGQIGGAASTAAGASLGGAITSKISGLFGKKDCSGCSPCEALNMSGVQLLSSGDAAWYFQQNPDVYAYFQKCGGFWPASAEQYASWHFQNFGRGEGRANPTGRGAAQTVYTPEVLPRPASPGGIGLPQGSLVPVENSGVTSAMLEQRQREYEFALAQQAQVAQQQIAAAQINAQQQAAQAELARQKEMADLRLAQKQRDAARAAETRAALDAQAQASAEQTRQIQLQAAAQAEAARAQAAEQARAAEARAQLTISAASAEAQAARAASNRTLMLAGGAALLIAGGFFLMRRKGRA